VKEAATARAQATAGGGDLDPTRDLELVAAEGHGADGDAADQCLLRRAHAPVGDGADGAVEDRAVGGEAEQARVGRGPDAFIGRGRQGCDDVDGLIGECLQRGADQPVIALELRRSRDEDDRRLDLVEKRRRLRGRVPVAGPDHDDIVGPVGARVLERLGRHVEQQRRRAVEILHPLQLGQAEGRADLVQGRQHRPLQLTDQDRLQRAVPQASEGTARRRQTGPEGRRVPGRKRQRIRAEGGPGAAP
jgi:hypothetical protein